MDSRGPQRQHNSNQVREMNYELVMISGGTSRSSSPKDEKARPKVTQKTKISLLTKEYYQKGEDRSDDDHEHGKESKQNKSINGDNELRNILADAKGYLQSVSREPKFKSNYANPSQATHSSLLQASNSKTQIVTPENDYHTLCSSVKPSQAVLHEKCDLTRDGSKQDLAKRYAMRGAPLSKRGKESASIVLETNVFQVQVFGSNKSPAPISCPHCRKVFRPQQSGAVTPAARNTPDKKSISRLQESAQPKDNITRRSTLVNESQDSQKVVNTSIELQKIKYVKPCNKRARPTLLSACNPASDFSINNSVQDQPSKLSTILTTANIAHMNEERKALQASGEKRRHLFMEGGNLLSRPGTAYRAESKENLHGSGGTRPDPNNNSSLGLAYRRRQTENQFGQVHPENVRDHGSVSKKKPFR